MLLWTKYTMCIKMFKYTYCMMCYIMYYTAITLMCSNISHGMIVREIGVKLAGRPVQAPFLKIGTTRTFFQSAGALHCFRVPDLIYCISVSI